VMDTELYSHNKINVHFYIVLDLSTTVNISHIEVLLPCLGLQGESLKELAIQHLFGLWKS
jgi:hypothetical protein